VLVRCTKQCNSHVRQWRRIGHSVHSLQWNDQVCYLPEAAYSSSSSSRRREQITWINALINYSTVRSAVHEKFMPRNDIIYAPAPLPPSGSTNVFQNHNRTCFYLSSEYGVLLFYNIHAIKSINKSNSRDVRLLDILWLTMAALCRFLAQFGTQW